MEQLETRYSRQTILPGFGQAAQERLANSRVLVVGAGGLGAPVLQYLAAAGVGYIMVVDGDTVSLSNLHRQVLFSEADLGLPKADCAAKRLHPQFPDTLFTVFNTPITAVNAAELILAHDLVVDGSDNFATRYLVNDACVLLGRPLVWGTVYQYEGHLSVFNYPVYQKGGALTVNLRCLFPEQPAADSIPNCAEAGVLGAVTGWLGSAMALEAIKVLTGVGEPLAGRLVTYDAHSHRVNQFSLLPDAQNPLFTGAIDALDAARYLDTACAVPDSQLITLTEWNRLLALHPSATVLDVREPAEHIAGNFGGRNLPLGKLNQQLGNIDRSQPVLLYCQRGPRSTQAARLLQAAGYTEIYTLAGGYAAYALASLPS
jgi:sulfur-carrier protein adenylyltransferase/sulfurtransferase